jgi:hypothetical protein
MDIHGHAAWTFMDMQHGQGHAAWAWLCSMDVDMDMQHGHGHGHAAWTRIWACSMDLDTQHGLDQRAWVMQHGPGQWTYMDAGMPIKSSVRHR